MPASAPAAAQAMTPQATPTVRALAAATPLPDASSLVNQGDESWSADFRGDLASSGWQPLSGQWGFENNTLVQSDPTGVDLAIAYTGSAFQNYVYDVSFTHRQGQSAGVLFNMPFTDRLNGAHMVRYSERRPGGIFWGYFDDAGKFIGEGYANVDPPASARHTLRVVSDLDSYSLYLDGFALVTDLPLRQNFGYVGLVTVQYDAVTVSGLEPVITPSASPAAVPALSASGVYTAGVTAADQRILSGQWEIEQGVYRQSVPDPGDYVLNTGVYASNYRIEADIQLPVKPEIGGGFTIHMPERGRRDGATVVRFINGGDGLFWGAYDAGGVFRGRGSVTLPGKAEGDNLYRLQVDVRGDVMDILVDGEAVASEIVLPRNEGWVGLVAHGGPVAFTNLQITVGGIQ